MANLCHESSPGCVSTINAGLARRSFSSLDSVNIALMPEADATGGKVLVTGSAGCEELMDSPRLPATLDNDPGVEDIDATELADPLRLVEVDDVPPKPEKPSVAGLDSSGNKSPVRVSFESQMRW